MAKKKIPGEIRFLPELDCISLEGVKQHFGSLCEDINFLYTIGQRFFQGGCGGPVKVYWFGSCTKKMELERDRCTRGRHLYFFSRNFEFLEIIFVSDCTKKMEQEHFGGGLLPI